MLDTNNKELIASRFKQVKSKGFIKSHRRNNTGIGKTFEDEMGVTENNLDAPDLAGYEIKAHREFSNSFITLFTKSPSFPQGANTLLRDLFGTPYEENPSLKKIHTSMFANKPNNYLNRYFFQLSNDRNDKEIRISVYSAISKKLINNDCGYTYSDLKNVFDKKLKNLFYVSAETKTGKNGVEYFHYNKADIYEKPSFEKFLTMIDNGFIMYDIRIGSYQSGSNIGKPHDHGSGFRIMGNYLSQLYNLHESID